MCLEHHAGSRAPCRGAPLGGCSPSVPSGLPQRRIGRVQVQLVIMPGFTSFRTDAIF